MSSSSTPGFENIFAMDTCSCPSCGSATDPIWQSHTTSDPQGCDIFRAHGGVPMNPANGGLTRTEFDFGTSCIGGLPVMSRDFSNLVLTASDTPTGRNWWNSILPTLVDRGDGLYVYTGLPRRRIYFRTDTKEALFYAKSKLVVGTEFVVTGPNGTRVRFEDAEGQPGILLGYIMPDGTEVNCEYDEDRVVSLTCEVAGGLVNGFYFTYPGSSERMDSATLKLAGQNIRRVLYQYDGEDLQLVIYEKYNEATAAWEETGRIYYRYYGPMEEGGFEHGLKARLDAEGWRRMVADGLNPLTATDEQLTEYAEFFLEYYENRRVSLAIMHGSEEHEFEYDDETPAWLDFTYDDFNQWTLRTKQILPDNNEVWFYANEYHQTIAKVFKKAGALETEQWTDAVQREEPTGHVDLYATPAAMTIPYLEDEYPEEQMAEFPVEKLIYSYTYSAENDLTGSSIVPGLGGTPVELFSLDYYERTVDGAVVTFLKQQIIQQDETSTAPSQTDWEYGDGTNWYSDTYQFIVRTTKLPVIPETQNGTNVRAEFSEYFDEDGNRIWLRNEREFLTAFFYDPITFAVTQTIDDVDTDILPAPEGWETPAGEGYGLHLVTDYENDPEGRNLQVLGPWHEVDLNGLATMVRRANWTVYGDSVHEIRQARGYITGQNTTPGDWVMNPVRIAKMDALGRVTDQIQAVRSSPGEAEPLVTGARVTMVEEFPETQWVRWSSTQYDNNGRQVSSRLYHLIPAYGAGENGTNYAQTSYGYDEMGRQNTVTAPGGTITKSTFTPMGWVFETLVGRDDGTPGNMRLVASRIYDLGQPGGNGNLTELTQPADPSPDRVTEFEYDWQDRKTFEGVSGANYHEIFGYDNVRLTLIARLTNAEVQLTLAQLSYDNQNRLFRREFSGGTDTLVEQLWYDPAGNTAKHRPLQGLAFVKMEYDGLNRLLARFHAAHDGMDTDPWSVEADLVIEQGESEYDAASNVIFQRQRLRFHNTSGEGPLGEPVNSMPPNARVYYSATYPDPQGRVIAMADYGTAGSTPPVRPALIPESTRLCSVTHIHYNARGEARDIVDGNGIVTRRDLDNAARLVKLTEDLHGPMPQVTEQRYNVDGLPTERIARNGAMPQVTAFDYGVVPDGDDGIARADLLRVKTNPNGGRCEFAYNRQSVSVQFEDPNGSVHAYDYDVLGRLTADRVTTPGANVNPAVRAIRQTYDDLDQVLSATSYNSPTATDPENILNQVVYTRNGFGQVLTEKQSHAGAVGGGTPTMTYTYANAAGNSIRRVTTQYPGGRTLEYQYGGLGEAETINNALGRVNLIVDTTNEFEVALYDWLGGKVNVKKLYRGPVGNNMRLTLTAMRPNLGGELGLLSGGGSSSSTPSGGEAQGDAGDQYVGLDRFGRWEDVRWFDENTGTEFERFQYGYDRTSTMIWRRNLVAPVALFDEHYQYDGLYQYTEMRRGTLNINTSTIAGVPTWQETFGRDPVGNIVGYDTQGTEELTQSRIYNTSNELLFINTGTETNNNSTVGYDENGNMITMPAVGPWSNTEPLVAQELEWDAWNRLVKITADGGSTVVGEYAYDGLGRRTTKTVGATITDFYYDIGGHVIQKQVSDEVTEEFLWGMTSARDLVLRERFIGAEDERLWATTDGTNCTSLLQLVDPNVTAVERIYYDAFGYPKFLTGLFVPKDGSTYDWEYCWLQLCNDFSTGLRFSHDAAVHPLLGGSVNADPCSPYMQVTQAPEMPRGAQDYLDRAPSGFLPPSRNSPGATRGGFSVAQGKFKFLSDINKESKTLRNFDFKYTADRMGDCKSLGVIQIAKFNTDPGWEIDSVRDADRVSEGYPYEFPFYHLAYPGEGKAKNIIGFIDAPGKQVRWFGGTVWWLRAMWSADFESCVVCNDKTSRNYLKIFGCLKWGFTYMGTKFLREYPAEGEHDAVPPSEEFLRLFNKGFPKHRGKVGPHPPNQISNF